MSWDVSYTTSNGHISFQSDDDINHCHFIVIETPRPDVFISATSQRRYQIS